MLRNGWKSLFFKSTSLSPQRQKTVRSSPERVQLLTSLPSSRLDTEDQILMQCDGSINSELSETTSMYMEHSRVDHDTELLTNEPVHPVEGQSLTADTSDKSDISTHIESLAVKDKFQKLTIGQTFDTFDDLYNLADDYAWAHYFKLTKSITYDGSNDATMDDNETSNLKSVSRGVLKCKGYKLSHCCFKIQFTSVKSSSCGTHYKIKAINLQHSGHDEPKPPLVIENKYMIFSESELTEDELQYISSVGPHMDLAKLRRMMSMTFGKEREYDSNLLNRVIIKSKKSRYGEGISSGINLFLAEGLSMKERGGVFVPQVDEFGRLAVVFIQSASMQKYADQYHDFQIIDGTHNTSMYSTLWIPFTLYD